MSKGKTEDTLAKATGLDGANSFDALLEKAQRTVDAFRDTIRDMGRENARLRVEIGELEGRLRKIEQNDRAAGHTPYRWRAAATHDAPSLMQ